MDKHNPLSRKRRRLKQKCTKGTGTFVHFYVKIEDTATFLKSCSLIGRRW